MPNDLFFDARPSRRTVTLGLAAGIAATVLPWRALALDTGSARALVVEAVAQVNQTINSGKSEQQMYVEFERLFSRYADVRAIARTALGVAARGASQSELSAFTQAYQGYIARKYGKRFREFVGSEIKVIDARPMKSAVEVISTAYLRNENPFEVRWHVSDRSGRPAFFNIIIEGVNMLASERAEIGALLDRNRGSIPALAEQLRRSS
uniref:Toluene tolerance family protein n=1 Tax=Cereibacter sphaeroides (strain ATCC 17025 / ATH 2.4.3) TaxID=349102 RepID=A4WNR4_CERS5